MMGLEQQEAVITILIKLIFIAVTWWAMQALHFEKMLKKGKVFQARVLFILLCIAIGSLISDFVIDYFNAGNQLANFFQ